MTLSTLLRVLGFVSFVIALLVIAAVFTVSTWGTGLFFAVLGLALWLLSIIVSDFGRDRNL